MPSDDAPATARASLGVTDHDWVAVFIGHEFDRKGLPIAIDAVARTPGVRLLVVGGSPAMIDRARASAAGLGAGDRVTFAGTRGDVVPALWAADALVLPSAYEANALVVLEALACGVPVIATAVGAAPELIADGENGYIIERDAGELATRLDALRAAPPGGLRAACRATAQTRSWTLVAQRYLEVIRRLRGEAPVDGTGAGRGE
jgi:UDP-glucose:(heptosyl)LPS alpha-1,3-glucosyltransferase